MELVGGVTLINGAYPFSVFYEVLAVFGYFMGFVVTLVNYSSRPNDLKRKIEKNFFLVKGPNKPAPKAKALGQKNLVQRPMPSTGARSWPA